MQSVIPAWRKMTGRCGVWNRLQCSEEAGAAPGLAARAFRPITAAGGPVGTTAEVAERC